MLIDRVIMFCSIQWVIRLKMQQFLSRKKEQNKKMSEEIDIFIFNIFQTVWKSFFIDFSAKGI